MIKKGIFGIIVITFAIAIAGCSDKKADAEYYKLAYDFYNDGKYEEAIENFKNILEYYPQGENAPKALFMIGFINANHINNYEEAKKCYIQFIEQYPTHELTASAKYEIETLGKDINELPIFKKIEEEVQKDQEKAEEKAKGN